MIPAVLLWALGCAAGGAAVLERWGPRRPSLGEQFAVGAVLLATLAFWASLAGLPLGLPLLVVLLGGMLGAGARPLLRRPRRIRPQPVEKACLAFTAMAFAVVAGQALWEPLLSWDARTHWTYLARVLYFDGEVFAPPIRDAASTLMRHDYPLLLPLSEWAVFALQGSADDHAARLVAAVFYGALLLALGGLLGRAVPRPLPAVGVALGASVPMLLLLRDGGASSGYADVPLALMVAVYLGFALDPRARVPAALAAFGILFTKREGLPLAMLCLAVPFALRPSRWREALGLAAAVALLALPWLVHQQGLPAAFGIRAATDPVAAASGLHRLPWILQGYAADLFLAPGLWGLLPWVVLALALARPRHDRLERVLLGLALAYLALHVAVYVVSPRAPWDANPTTRVRTLFHVAPALLLYGALRAGRRVRPRREEPALE